MESSDAPNVKNNIKIRSIVFWALIYIVLLVGSGGLLIIPILIVWIIAFIIYKTESEAIGNSSTEFKKSFPFRYLGAVYADFEHVFHHDKNIDSKVFSALNKALTDRELLPELQAMEITDKDGDLVSPESRGFLFASSDRTSRGTTLSLAVRQSSLGKSRSFHWWILAGGYIDKNRVFGFMALSPLSIWFWLPAYIRNEYNIFDAIRVVHPSSYNDMDVQTLIQSINYTVFDTLVEELDKNGIDTSDLKTQKMQSLNINISGGDVKMGNIVQGAMNKVAANVSGKKK